MKNDPETMMDGEEQSAGGCRVGTFYAYNYH